MAETVLRLLEMLHAIPRAPGKVSVQLLAQRLSGLGFRVTDRTIQRDLNSLSSVLPLHCDDRSRPYGWQFARDGAVTDIPGMDCATALTFLLARSFLDPLMPRSVQSALAPHMARAEQVLSRANVPLQDWPRKVRILPRGQQLITPEVAPDVLEVVYQALLEERRFTARYHPKSSPEPKDYQLSPLGLVFRNGVIYLVCTQEDSPQLKQFVLHRMHSAQLTDLPANIPDGFELDAYIRERSFDYPEGGQIRLEVLLAPQVAAYLQETPLSPDQALTLVADGRTRLSATVMDTQQLRWWLQGFGALVEVVAPEGLRQAFRETARQLVARYAEVETEA